MSRSRPASLRVWRRAALAFGLLAATLHVSACSDPVATTVSVASVDVTPATSSVRAGGTVVLVAKPKDAAGAAVDVRTLTWSSSNKTVATVSASGVVSALAPGEARIAVSALGKSATAVITVTAREVASVVVTPATVSMRVGVTAPLQAQTLDSDGQPLTGRVTTWTSSNNAIATVNAQGVVTGVSVGAATITATSEGRAGQAAVTVTLTPVQTVVVSPAVDTLAVGTERAHTAVLRDAANNVLTGRALAWSSNNVAVASVSSSGVVTGLGPGTVTISATSEGRIGTATVVVLARLAGAVTLTPSSNTVVVGATQQLVTQITDSLGNLLTGRPVVYASDAPTVASVSATGLVTALSPGNARITASSEGKTGTATVQVINVPVATVQVTPTTTSLFVGATQQLAAVARSAANTVLTGRTVTWTSGAPGIASVTANGLVTALSPGVAIVLATIDGVTASSTVTVSVPAVASIVITPVDPTVAVFGTLPLVATLRDANGNTLTGRAVTWTSADESVAFVSSTGIVAGFKVGTVRITVTSEGISASTIVTVR